MTDFDAVVIGAGNAGLTAAATLQRGGLRTLLVERHSVPGGCGTSFRRGRFEFEVALHQLSGVGVEGQERRTLRGLFGKLGVLGKVDFVQEDDLYRAVVPGCYDVTIPADWDRAAEALETAFPGNRENLRRFFRLVREVTFWRAAALRGIPAGKIDQVFFRNALRTLQDVLDEHFDDPRIKHALSAYWPYLGQPPSKLSFQDMAATLFGYLEFKPWHVKGGSQAMSSAIFESFAEAGGTALFTTSVDRILTGGGAVTGVRLSDGQEFSTREVVSNAALPVTYDLLDGKTPAAVRADLATRRVGVSGFVLHMGLAAAPAELGFTTSTSFISADLDNDRAYASMRTLEPARSICVSSYDVTPIGFAPPGSTHASLMTLQYASPWQTVPPSEYATTKFAYAETLLDRVEALLPDVRAAIEEVDVATPVTLERYLGHPGGAIYGYAQDRTEGWLFRDDENDPPVPGLHVAGAWSGLGGFQPTLEAGARVATRMLRENAA
ncbi:phytoene desaturase family protein [Amycolatopsis sp. CA-230715]|uniref:phytoene desaturase family protein n=1 Tax=Amycolatopsis sp. CA-230715 TaxID=2745196 RepID=UPI001C02F869|nr:NAD(P)/FAD-dependent oxidoreductase [Amycolatopsis sp. CA-230715]QWF84643.1 Phytoene desaturase (lycopene-forming) [Amycolatopsis sp. CA-230715]